MRQAPIAFALLLLASCAGVRNTEPWNGQVRVDAAMTELIRREALALSVLSAADVAALASALRPLMR